MSQGPSFTTLPLFNPVEFLKQVSTIKALGLPSYLSGHSQTRPNFFWVARSASRGNPGTNLPTDPSMPMCTEIWVLLAVGGCPHAESVDCLTSNLPPRTLALLATPETGASGEGRRGQLGTLSTSNSSSPPSHRERVLRQPLQPSPVHRLQRGLEIQQPCLTK